MSTTATQDIDTTSKTDHNNNNDTAMNIDNNNNNSNSNTATAHSKKQRRPSIKPMSAQQIQTANNASVYIRIPVPSHRLTPLKNNWAELYQPIVEHMKLQIRYNVKKRCIELRVPHNNSNSRNNAQSNDNDNNNNNNNNNTTTTTTDSTIQQATPGQQSSLTRTSDFIRAFLLGFELHDAIALLRLDDLFIDSFEIKDVKTLTGEHLSRAIGRIAGVNGKTKYTIENSTKTRIVLADTTIHILGSYNNINIAKQSIVRLIMGTPPAKVYTHMRAVSQRMKQKF